MTTKPSFLKKARDYLIPTFVISHFVLGAVILLNAPSFIIVFIGIALLIFYAAAAVISLTYLARLTTQAVKEVLTEGLSNDIKQAIAICVVTGLIALVFFKLFD